MVMTITNLLPGIKWSSRFDWVISYILVSRFFREHKAWNKNLDYQMLKYKTSNIKLGGHFQSTLNATFRLKNNFPVGDKNSKNITSTTFQKKKFRRLIAHPYISIFRTGRGPLLVANLIYVQIFPVQILHCFLFECLRFFYTSIFI